MDLAQKVTQKPKFREIFIGIIPQKSEGDKIYVLLRKRGDGKIIAKADSRIEFNYEMPSPSGNASKMKGRETTNTHMSLTNQNLTYSFTDFVKMLERENSGHVIYKVLDDALDLIREMEGVRDWISAKFPK
jgi:hypothetical protein